MWTYLTYHVSCFSPQPPFSFLLLFLNSIPLLSKSSFTVTAVYLSPFCHPLPASLFSFSNFFPLPPSQHRLLSRWEYFTQWFKNKKKIVKELILAALSSSEYSYKPVPRKGLGHPHNQTCMEILVSCVLSSEWIWGFMALSDTEILSWLSAFCIKLQLWPLCVYRLIKFSFITKVSASHVMDHSLNTIVKIQSFKIQNLKQ